MGNIDCSQASHKSMAYDIKQKSSYSSRQATHSYAKYNTVVPATAGPCC